MSPKYPLDPKVLPAVTAILVMGIGVLGAKLQLGLTPESIAILGGSAAVLIVCWMQARKCSRSEKGVQQAETLSPGITKPLSPNVEVTITRTENNVTNDDKPVVTTRTTPAKITTADDDIGL